MAFRDWSGSHVNDVLNHQISKINHFRNDFFFIDVDWIEGKVLIWACRCTSNGYCSHSIANKQTCNLFWRFSSKIQNFNQSRLFFFPHTKWMWIIILAYTELRCNSIACSLMRLIEWKIFSTLFCDRIYLILLSH